MYSMNKLSITNFEHPHLNCFATTPLCVSFKNNPIMHSLYTATSARLSVTVLGKLEFKLNIVIQIA